MQVKDKIEVPLGAVLANPAKTHANCNMQHARESPKVTYVAWNSPSISTSYAEKDEEETLRIISRTIRVVPRTEKILPKTAIQC